MPAARADTPTDWHTLDAAEAADRLGSDRERGLSAVEVAERRAQYGANVLETAGRPPWYALFARQFVDVLILILMAAAVISAVVGEIADALTILAIVVLNGALGFVQEWKAEQALAALQRMLSLRSNVIRGGNRAEIDAADLVPGDLVLLEIGDRVPADVRLVEAVDLRVDESPLTGESVPVRKDVAACARDAPLADRVSMLWMGTAITNGHARALVAATGMATEFGRIARLTQSVGEEATPLHRKLATLGKQLGIASIIVSALVAAAGMWLGKPTLEMFFTGISLAVAVVPEGLPAVVTITLALGIRAMVRRRALLRRLQAAEALGAATVVCTDKTGTLTQNEMTVTRIWLPSGEIAVTGVGYDPQGHFEKDGEQIDYAGHPDLLALLEAGLICNHARISRDETGWREYGEPTEASLVVAAYKAWLSPDDNGRALGEFSFNSARKRMTTIVHRGSGRIAFSKGAPEVMLERCSRIKVGDTVRAMTDTDHAGVVAAFTGLAESGLRTLAFARRELPDHVDLSEDEIETDMVLLGIAGIIDPPRPEVPGAIALARAAGIRVVMITGDAAATALSIGRDVGLDAAGAITGAELDGMDDARLATAIEDNFVFARTTPEHKLRIVSLLQARDNVVGMTGDGVNDAPALKKADIGIAMGLRGTDVAKGAADMVLTDDNFASIIGAVEEGRRQYDNIQKFVRYMLSSNMGEVIAIFLNILLGGPLILLPVQILWMNLVTDGVTAAALGTEEPERDVMRRAPRGPNEPILNRAGMLTILALGGYIGVVTLWLFHHYLEGGGPEKVMLAQTVAFTGIIVLEKMNVFNFRALRDPLAVIGFFSNRWVLIAWAGTLGLQACAVYVPFLQKALHTVPLGWQDWGLIVAVSAPVFVVAELFKWLRWRARNQGQDGSSSVSQ